MKKWILVALSLSLVFITVKFYPFIEIMFAQTPAEPVMLTHTNIMERLKKTAAEKEELNYLVLGDSVARGYGSKLNHGYSSVVAEELAEQKIPMHLENRGVVGQTSKKLYDYVRTPDIQNEIKNADFISLTIGGNDLVKVALENKDPLSVVSKFHTIQRQYKENLSKTLSHIRELNPKAPIVMTSLYNPVSSSKPYYSISNTLMEKWNVGLKEVAYQYPTTRVVDVNERLQHGGENWLSDQIHPNDHGYKLIALGILNNIREGKQSAAGKG
ncbi:GDSL-type esterase/lipase family protein [Marininema halotolerans]|uniref:Lysophospholipase L1 n=1 Tax=Marininema halotolerans TaxID=1155944 RepID=A0A1I6SY11_9BACL|nr:GDSL-type esterase/lipase family protein [Marininema halotolerans]SFS81688.1 Lysophospholipase L1 [Marininema halotolerans]